MTVLTNLEADPINSLGGVSLIQGDGIQKWPTLTARHGHALQRRITNSMILVQHHFMTVLTNFEADPINSLGGVHSNTRQKSEKNSKWPPKVKIRNANSRLPVGFGAWVQEAFL